MENVEVAFRKSNACVSTNCVEVGQYGPAMVAIRDSKDPEIELLFDRIEWAAFVAGVKNGEFDLP